MNPKHNRPFLAIGRLMDLHMLVMNGVQATSHIHEAYPEIRVLVLTTYDDDHWVFNAIRAGADGYLLKDTLRKKLIEAIRGTVGGQTYVVPSVAGKLFKQVAQPQALDSPDTEFAADLSERELDVLRLIAEGYKTAKSLNGCTSLKEQFRIM